MRVQLLHPVSRFKRVQSLQHLCRYIIVKHVRKDHLDQLPVPSRIKNYLNTPFYYSEQVEMGLFLRLSTTKLRFDSLKNCETHYSGEGYLLFIASALIEG